MFKLNKVKVDLCSYPPFLFLAQRKFGKTTFWRNLVNEVWGNPTKGLLISCGREEGYHALENIQVAVAKDWNSEFDEETSIGGFVSIIDLLVDHQDELGIKGVCIDTLDTLVDIATDEVLRLHRKEKHTACKSLNEAFAGYGRGPKRLVDIITEQIGRLRDAGYAVFILCHTKNKEKTDLKSGEKYEQITTNLPDNIFSAFGDNGQMTMVGVFDREIENGKMISEDRVIYLRNTAEVDAGGRFTHVPEKIPFTVKDFMNAFEEAAKAEIANSGGKTTVQEINKRKKAEEKARDEHAKKAKAEEEEHANNDEEKNLELLAEIKIGYKEADTEQRNEIKKIMAKNGIKNFKTADVPTAGLQEIADFVNSFATVETEDDEDKE